MKNKKCYEGYAGYAGYAGHRTVKLELYDVSSSRIVIGSVFELWHSGMSSLVIKGNLSMPAKVCLYEGSP